MKKERKRLMKYMIFNIIRSNDGNAYMDKIVINMNILQKIIIIQ